MIDWYPLLGVIALLLLLMVGSVLAVPNIIYRASKLWMYGQLKAKQDFELRNKRQEEQPKQGV